MKVGPVVRSRGSGLLFLILSAGLTHAADLPHFRAGNGTCRQVRAIPNH